LLRQGPSRCLAPESLEILLTCSQYKTHGSGRGGGVARMLGLILVVRCWLYPKISFCHPGILGNMPRVLFTEVTQVPRLILKTRNIFLVLGKPDDKTIFMGMIS